MSRQEQSSFHARQGGNSVLLALLTLMIVCSVPLVPEFAHAKKAPSPNQTYGGYTGPQEQPGGYVGPGPQVLTVQDALTQRDETWVALKGTITRRLGSKDYMFTDSTGNIEVQIGNKEWKGQEVGPQDVVELHGKIHKDWLRTHVHVKRLIKQ